MGCTSNTYIIYLAILFHITSINMSQKANMFSLLHIFFITKVFDPLCTSQYFRWDGVLWGVVISTRSTLGTLKRTCGVHSILPVRTHQHMRTFQLQILQISVPLTLMAFKPTPSEQGAHSVCPYHVHYNNNKEQVILPLNPWKRFSIPMIQKSVDERVMSVQGNWGMCVCMCV